MNMPSPKNRIMPQAANSAFCADVITGLSATPKSLPSKYFYDEQGSRLFDAICELDEYYPTRTEMGLLRAHAAEIVAMAGRHDTLVEFGAGSLQKIRILLERMHGLRRYIPVDISTGHLRAASRTLARGYPGLDVRPVAADFIQPVPLPVSGSTGMIGFFPGSTIGNFSPAEAADFLKSAAGTLGRDALFLVGVDLRKDSDILDAAYNDSQGITAAFNLNLLARINRELNGTFDLERFRHRAFFNDAEGRVEMHLQSTRDQLVRVSDRSFAFARGETIHTENSYKYDPAAFIGMAQRAGWNCARFWTDGQNLFGLCMLTRAEP